VPAVTDIRALFSDAADAAAPLVADPVLKERFDGPSALARRERDAVEALRVL
jgi:hypothetical protein